MTEGQRIAAFDGRSGASRLHFIKDSKGRSSLGVAVVNRGSTAHETIQSEPAATVCGGRGCHRTADGSCEPLQGGGLDDQDFRRTGRVRRSGKTAVSKAVSLDRLRDISRQRSTQRLQSARVSVEGDKAAGEQRTERVEWPIPR